MEPSGTCCELQFHMTDTDMLPVCVCVCVHSFVNLGCERPVCIFQWVRRQYLSTGCHNVLRVRQEAQGQGHTPHLLHLLHQCAICPRLSCVTVSWLDVLVIQNILGLMAFLRQTDLGMGGRWNQTWNSTTDPLRLDQSKLDTLFSNWVVLKVGAARGASKIGRKIRLKNKN